MLSVKFLVYPRVSFMHSTGSHRFETFKTLHEAMTAAQNLGRGAEVHVHTDERRTDGSRSLSTPYVIEVIWNSTPQEVVDIVFLKGE